MHITYIYLDIIQNKGYTPGLALDRRGVRKVSHWWLRGFPHVREPPPRTHRSPPRTPARPRS